MHVRLAFSVSIQVDADILLIDEVLAVGDASFAQKCFDVFNTLRDAGRTIVLVTHDMGLLSRFCHRALLLERGVPVHLGEPHEVADRYLEINFGRDPEATEGADAGDDATRSGDGDARVLEVWVEDEHGERPPALSQGRRITVKAMVRFSVDATDPEASLYLLNEEHKAVLVTTTARDHERSGAFQAGQTALFSFAFENVFTPGRYSIVLTLAHRGSGLDLMDRFEGTFSFVVTGTNALGGAVDLPVEVGVSAVEASDVPGTLLSSPEGIVT